MHRPAYTIGLPRDQRSSGCNPVAVVLLERHRLPLLHLLHLSSHAVDATSLSDLFCLDFVLLQNAD
jgi:hypothetical protein